MEHHSNILPWQMVARQTGAKLLYLECEKDGSHLPDEKLEAVIGPKVKSWPPLAMFPTCWAA